jgi:hypothetical protein
MTVKLDAASEVPYFEAEKGFRTSGWKGAQASPAFLFAQSSRSEPFWWHSRRVCGQGKG